MNLSPDRPITCEKEDKLGRAHFAGEMTNAICNWKEKDNLIIAINGKWGDGKSSIKNLIKENLEKRNDNPRFVEFSPWQISGQEILTSHFFTFIGKVIGSKNEKIKELINKYEKLVLNIELAETIIKIINISIYLLLILSLAAQYLDKKRNQ